MSTVFIGVSLYGHDYLNIGHEVNSISSPLPSPEFGLIAWGSKPNHLSIRLVFPVQSAPVLELTTSLPRVTSLHKLRSGPRGLPSRTNTLQSLGKFQGFRSFLPGTWDKDQTNIYTIALNKYWLNINVNIEWINEWGAVELQSFLVLTFHKDVDAKSNSNNPPPQVIIVTLTF